MGPEGADARRGAADRLVLVGRFASLVYVNVLVWLSVWVLIPTLFMGWRPMAIESGSMGPTIHAGDVVLVEPFRDQPVEAGRVITYEDPAKPGRLVTHRVTAVNDDGTYRTKGDANTDADSTPLEPRQIRGVGRLVVPRVGLPVVWLTRSQYGALAAWAISVVVALFLLAPSRPADPAPVPASAPRVRFRLARRPDTTLSVPPGAGVPTSAGFVALPRPPGAPASAYPLVPGVRYKLRLPRPPAPLELPAPPRWSVSLVPPAPGTTTLTPIPAPPRPAAVRRGNALTTRQVPGWTGRLHSVLATALVLSLVMLGTAAAPPASAAFSSTRHSVVGNSANSFAAGQLVAPHSPTITAPLAACRITVGWSPSTTSWRDGYRVYRAVNGSAYSLLTTAAYDAIGYIDNSANNSASTYSYRMVAYKAVTWESPATAPVSASPSAVACAGG